MTDTKNSAKGYELTINMYAKQGQIDFVCKLVELANQDGYEVVSNEDGTVTVK